MPDFRSMYEKEYVYAYDLGGKDVTVTIKRVKAAEITGTGGKKTKKPVIFFEGSDKGLALCVTNGRTIATLYGYNTEDWVGKRITMYPTRTTFGGEEVDCIRIRPSVPRAARVQSVPATPESDPSEATA